MEKYAYSIAANEMERRWCTTLTEMKDKSIDCLILYANVGKLGGAMMYLTDVYAAGSYPHCAIFSQDGIFLIGHGNKNGTMTPRNLELGNIAENVGLPITPSMCYADNFYPDEMIRIIRTHGYRRIGMVGLSYISAAIYKHLTETLTGCEFINATEMMDHIRAIKSEYELDMWQRCVRLHERIFAAIPSVLRPGRTEYEVVQETEYLAKRLGCPYCSVMIGSDAVCPVKSPALYRNKRIEAGDYVNFLLELSAPGGIWGELGRVFSIGEPNEAMRQAELDSIQLQSLIAINSKPGTKPCELLVLLNEELKRRGYREEQRIFAHGQGYDIVERPVYSEWESMPLEENMLVAIHPTCANRGALCSNTDNFVITEHGAERLSTIPGGIIVIQ